MVKLHACKTPRGRAKEARVTRNGPKDCPCLGAPETWRQNGTTVCVWGGGVWTRERQVLEPLFLALLPIRGTVEYRLLGAQTDF